jgi:poly-gamma-glutamate synthesis protein (capsule biosynthesis protein)
MYKDISDLVSSADFAFVNQETPLGGDELGISGYPNFNGPQDAGKALVKLGFDIVNIATNHMLDKKEKGLQGSIDFWNGQPVTLLGGYIDKEDYENIRVIEKNGIKIAFLSYTYGLNGMTISSSSKLYIPLINQDEIVSMIKKANKFADMVFVVMHWGEENSFQISSSQKTLAKAISAAGADAIIGMHPHTVQPMEWISNADGSRTLVIYSLGNLISTMYDNFNMVGGIVTFDIIKSKNGEVTIEKPIYNPVVTHYDKDRLNLQVYLLKNYTAELAAAHGTVFYGSDKRFTLDIAKGYVTKTISSEFLPDYLKQVK